jgi:hypothetical protein
MQNDVLATAQCFIVREAGKSFGKMASLEDGN